MFQNVIRRERGDTTSPTDDAYIGCIKKIMDDGGSYSDPAECIYMDENN